MSNARVATGILVYRQPILAPPASVALTSNTADPLGSVVTTAAPHLLQTGDQVTIAGNTGSTPAINGTHKVTVLSATTYRIPIVTTVAGTGGTSLQAYAVIGELTNVGPGEKSRNEIPTSTHNDGSESKELGMLRQSNPTFDINYVGSDQTHVAIQADIDNNVANLWMFLFPSGLSRSGTAKVQKFALKEVGLDAVQAAAVALVWKSVVTEVAGT